MKRESLNTPIQSPHFQSRRGMLNNTGGTYSHSGLMDYPSIPITEWNLRKFLTLWNFKAGRSTSELGLFTNSRSSGHNALDQRS